MSSLTPETRRALRDYLANFKETATVALEAGTPAGDEAAENPPDSSGILRWFGFGRPVFNVFSEWLATYDKVQTTQELIGHSKDHKSAKAVVEEAAVIQEKESAEHEELKADSETNIKDRESVTAVVEEAAVIQEKEIA